MLRKFNVHDIKTYRERHCCSMEEAKAGLRREIAIEAVESAESLADIKVVLIAILKNEI